MNFSGILKADSANGPGLRVSLFVSGCTNRCKGCFNEQTWDFNYGRKWTEGVEDEILKELEIPYYDGITILGGEPFEPSNQEGLAPFIKRLRANLPQKTIWMYTGNLYEDLLPDGKRYVEGVTNEILENIDVLVDGRFEERNKSLLLNFRGSSNQRIINIPETRKAGQVILSKLNN